jgi:hypothetical protein
VVSKYRTLRDADVEIAEQLLIIEATWTKISQQLTFLRSVWDKLNAEHQDLQQRILLVFQNRLEVAMLEVSNIGTAPNKPKAAKYAIYIKELLEKTIRDLKTWVAEFDPTWWLILLMSDKATDKLSTRLLTMGWQAGPEVGASKPLSISVMLYVPCSTLQETFISKRRR